MEDYADLPSWKLYYNLQDEARDIVDRVSSGKREFISPDDAYLSTVTCLAADMSMARNGAPVGLADVESSR